MDPGAADSPVNLVIKAPNQKYQDQTITCFLSWTVEKLKSHISDVYPSKPRSKDQRLVYSGKLLQDHLQLKDVLRQQQDDYHMLHLVCSSHTPPGSPVPQRTPTINTADISSPEIANSSSAAASPSDSLPSSSSSPTAGHGGLRHRRVSSPLNLPQTPAGAPQWPHGAQVPMRGGQMFMPMQMLWWQQMYAQHYYMQYQAAVAASQPLNTPPTSVHPPPYHPNEAVQPPLGPAPAAANPLPENPPQANANIQMNAQGGAVLNEDELNRDWLDWMYTLSRASVLLSIVYFYSSFSRFIMVVGAMLLVYLHQAGWFPFRPQEQNLQGAELAQAPREEARRHQDIQEMERLMDDGVEDEDSSEEGVQEDPTQAAAALPEPSLLSTAWSFISTFFTSLVPEGRPVPAN
ncbi:homocysteine-responsive endoplasmic reticulum-resident ubiquitin-like domain member 2 protein isoform X2 [Dunckerocampus dactyliophorus]|uniref:homocysteine-responsive endoplasmic reticulum-resident ubiquitin-like domain member 2 protein isoform X2 n=1 Tax=Dunckerocampus dactyliophorus TaxID=161453 RepID=UPI00240618B5|nr:homocysteine-responsive endoplasmic reticulum-resident ubiquitin-like domain member 2 protein isoform X2 [Dunckerocampus dactyliophorus]